MAKFLAIQTAQQKPRSLIDVAEAASISRRLQIGINERTLPVEEKLAGISPLEMSIYGIPAQNRMARMNMHAICVSRCVSCLPLT